jgi:hypothetical protein
VREREKECECLHRHNQGSKCKFRSAGILLKSETKICRQKNEKRLNGYSSTDKCRHEIQEQKEVPVWYTGIYRPISSTGHELYICTVLNPVVAAAAAVVVVVVAAAAC